MKDISRPLTALKNLERRFPQKTIQLATDILFSIDKSHLWEIPPLYPYVLDPRTGSELLLDWTYNPSVSVTITDGFVYSLNIRKFNPDNGDCTYSNTWLTPDHNFILDVIPRVLSLQEDSIVFSD